MLRHSVQKSPKEWSKILSTLEFEYNSALQESTGFAPLEVDICHIPLSARARKYTLNEIPCQSAREYADTPEAYRVITRDNGVAAHAKQRYYANKHWNKCTQFDQKDLLFCEPEVWNVLRDPSFSLSCDRDT